jgi:hypothetical protein
VFGLEAALRDNAVPEMEGIVGADGRTRKVELPPELPQPGWGWSERAHETPRETAADRFARALFKGW